MDGIELFLKLVGAMSLEARVGAVTATAPAVFLLLVAGIMELFKTAKGSRTGIGLLGLCGIAYAVAGFLVGAALGALLGRIGRTIGWGMAAGGGTAGAAMGGFLGGVLFHLTALALYLVQITPAR